MLRIQTWTDGSDGLPSETGKVVMREGGHLGLLLGCSRGPSRSSAFLGSSRPRVDYFVTNGVSPKKEAGVCK